MMDVKLFVEGGGDGASQRAKFRENFRKLLSKIGLKGQPSIAACGGRDQARKDFAHYRQGYGLLLVDSEDPVEKNDSPWDHLHARDGDEWVRPDHTSDDQCHLMVQCMEAWFVADMENLKKIYGIAFKKDKLPQHRTVETISKKALFDSLEDATRECKPKGPYSKGKHSFDIIGLIDPQKIRARSGWAERFFAQLDEVMKKYR